MARVFKAKVDFSSVEWGSVEWTNLVTLYLRAHESRSRRPILGDQAAAEAVDRIDYDFNRMQRTMVPASNQYLVALRASANSWTTGAPIFCTVSPTRLSFTSAAGWTAVRSGSHRRRRCCGSISISRM